MVAFSLITCTYNPDERILSRCIRSLEQLDTMGVEVEFIIIDNNSSLPVKKMKCIEQLDDSRFCIIEEPKLGLANARIRGVKEAKSPIILFVDDDNVLSPEYLQGINVLLKKHPFVGVWGAGKIDVDFIDGAPEWIRKHVATKFQYRDCPFTEFGCVIGWPDYYPVGSGLIVKREVFEAYSQLFEKGILSATDRMGNNLASAGDSQIIWSAIKKGIPAGTSPLLHLTHLIPAKRANYTYLKRLNYNLSLSYYKALHEIFPEANQKYQRKNWLHKVELVMKNIIRTKGNVPVALKLTNISWAWEKGMYKALNT